MTRLPGDSRRIMAIVARSAPNPDRPRLPDEYEAILHPADRARAACYASMEDLSDRLASLSETIDETVDGVDVDAEETFGEDESSLVTNIAAVRGARAAGR